MLNVEWSSTRGRAGHSTLNIEHSTFRFCYPHSYPVKPFLLSLAVLAGSVASAEPLRVGTITIHALDVYSSEEASKGWVYRAANSVHVQTRKSTIRRFLLFHEGDPYEPAKLADLLASELSAGIVLLGAGADRPLPAQTSQIMRSESLNLAGETRRRWQR